ncbi:mitogen-activated protein kinase kinase kinase 15-like isoform X2 [Lineus longissimus]|uniref:mitogen-activated protein kinase kinase kinase 15-like isoform X2 n=1 Tax=Lineus longissimus TaxID=88925 RepID=UPI00315C7F6F
MSAAVERKESLRSSGPEKPSIMKVVSLVDLNGVIGASASLLGRRQALAALERACNSMKAELEHIQFEKLDFGELIVLDHFYNADVAIVDISVQVQQSALFYHIGVRESMGMTDNFVLFYDTDPDITSVLKLSCNFKDNFLPYTLDETDEAVLTDISGIKIISDKMPRCKLWSKLRKGLKEIERDTCAHLKEKFIADLRKAREAYKGEDLRKTLKAMRTRLDDPLLLSVDVVMNMLISYREIQDYDAMVSLVEDLDSLPNNKITNSVGIKHLHAFALNRRNRKGDRDKALDVILEAIESNLDQPVPDMLCLCGRIYKDKFVESDYTDSDSRDQAIDWYRKGFDVQPNEYAGINLATLLVISGKDFASSSELKRIGLTLNNLIGRKGSLPSLKDYWDVATFFEISVLAEEFGKASQAAECMFKLEPPIWYLKSTVGNISLIDNFRKPPGDIEPSLDRQLFNFWMEFFMEATKPDFTGVLYPVLVLEPNKVFMPSYLQLNKDNEEQSIRLWHLFPNQDGKTPHDWLFTAESIKSVSLYKRDCRAVFLYVQQNSDDFQVYFSSESQRQMFYEDVLEIISEHEGAYPDLDDVDYTSGPVQFEYEYDENSCRVTLGRGTYGTVFAARELNTQVRIAVKEVPDNKIQDHQPLHEEIKLHSRLHHKNIVKYLGSLSEDGYFKILMEQVPGGSLSQLLRSMWGPLKDSETTIAYYTTQILEGIKYLHDNKIVHRDIKGDNVLVNTYSGILKISDFGTSKRLTNLNLSAETFTGTLQYMAPEVIDKGARGYGPPADIWSLGCTVVEMATGKPPFIELGSPEAAMFKVGFYKAHPEIPESMSDKVKAFLLRCFEPDPDKRATAAMLLEDPFLKDLMKKKKKHKVHPDFGRSVSVPAGVVPLSPDRDLDNGLRSPDTEGIPSSSSSQNLQHYQAQMSTTSSVMTPTTPTTPEIGERTRTGSFGSTKRGFYLLRKDSERRLTLAQILTKDEDVICDQWLEFLMRDTNITEPKLSKSHLKVMLAGLSEFVKDQNKENLIKGINSVKEDVDFDMAAVNEIQMCLYVFQETVQSILRQQNIQPHWIFALDNFLRNAVQNAIIILSPELGAHIGGANQGASAAAAPPPYHQEEKSSTSGVSTIDSAKSQHIVTGYDNNVVNHLQDQIRALQDENKRLLEQLVQSQQAYQELLKSNLEEKQLLTEHFRLVARAAGDMTDGPSLIVSPSMARRLSIQADDDLVRWLQQLHIDEQTVQKFVDEEYDLETVKEDMTRDDLRRLGIRGGVQLRIWRAIQGYRNNRKRDHSETQV